MGAICLLKVTSRCEASASCSPEFAFLQATKTSPLRAAARRRTRPAKSGWLALIMFFNLPKEDHPHNGYSSEHKDLQDRSRPNFVGSETEPRRHRGTEIFLKQSWKSSR